MSYALPPDLHLLGDKGCALLRRLHAAVAAHNRAREQAADTDRRIQRLLLEARVMAARAEAERRQGMH